jgi:hypothetical protein
MSAASIDLRDLEAELSKTRSAVESWAQSKIDVATKLRDDHCYAMQDQSGVGYVMQLL